MIWAGGACMRSVSLIIRWRQSDDNAAKESIDGSLMRKGKRPGTGRVIKCV